MQHTVHTSHGFTLVEIMVVIAIVIILAMFVSVPYSYYADRTRVRDAGSRIEQLWTLAHTEVKNGAVFSGSTNTHLLMTFIAGTNHIDLYSVRLGLEKKDIPASLPTQDIVLREKLDLGKMSLLSVSPGNTLRYFLEAPSGTGTFLENASLSGITITIGYKNATLASGRAREIQLIKP